MRPNSEQRGVTTVMVAVCMVALLSFSGLALDGGQAYANRRQQQNAADAAALAGTQKFNQEWTTPGTMGDILRAVQSAATNNRGAVAQHNCFLIDQTGADRAPCPIATDDDNPGLESPSTLNAYAHFTVAGVRVTSVGTVNSYVAQAVGVGTFSASATAAAQLEQLTSLDSNGTPVMVCGTAQGVNGGGLTTPPQSQFPSPEGPPIIDAQNNFNSSAIGWQYHLHFANNAAPPKCGLGPGNSWDGNVAQTGASLSIPGAWPSSNGNHGVNIVNDAHNSTLVGPYTDANGVTHSGCPTGGAIDGCLLVVPICYQDTTSSLYCVRLAVFQLISLNGQSRFDGTLLGIAPVVTGGQGGGVPTSAIAPRLIKLSA